MEELDYKNPSKMGNYYSYLSTVPDGANPSQLQSIFTIKKDNFTNTYKIINKVNRKLLTWVKNKTGDFLEYVSEWEDIASPLQRWLFETDDIYLYLLEVF